MLLNLFDAAVDAVNGETAVRRALANDHYDNVYLVAVGKAAAAMATGALLVLNDRFESGLLISKYDHITPELLSDARLRCMEAAHPVPDQHSLDAGDALLSFVASVPEQAHLLFLTSGGASSLVELLPPTMSLADLQKINVYLHSSGLDINAMNVIRKSLSRIKGGRLAAAVNCKHTRQLLISDVPGDDISSIGSGLLVPPNPNDEKALQTLDLPNWLRAFFVVKHAPDALNPVWETIESTIVASNAIACTAIAEQARQSGLSVQLDSGVLSGDVAEMSRHVVNVLSSPNAKPGVYIWGGETTVKLPETPGRGGRNQQLAVQLALDMQNTGTSNQHWQALCCGTDGSDGPTMDAGGLVDHLTIDAGKQVGLDAKVYLDNADCGHYLKNIDALVTTGPTGTNVMDVLIVII